MYSAVKINGQPLYKLAREGETVERKARPIEIYGIEYGGSPAENEYVLAVSCSKGTYIRTLLEEIADRHGAEGHHERPAPHLLPGCTPKPMPTRWKKFCRKRAGALRPWKR